MDFDVNKLNCIFTYFEEYIDESIYQVLNDSPTDPDYSAVTATNLIKSYIQIKTERVKSFLFRMLRNTFYTRGFQKKNMTFLKKVENPNRYIIAEYSIRGCCS